MKILLDSCVWGGAAAPLRAAGHDVEWTGDWPTDPGDAQILAQAARDHQILVTLDKDFGELAIVHERPHSGIVRLVNLRAQRQGPTVVRVVARYGAELAQGALVTVDAARVRVRPPRTGASQ